MEIIYSAVIGFLLGSIPTAYILIKKFRNKDIRDEGSKNVGALNSYEVSNSKLIGSAVLLADLGKGFLAVYLAYFISGSDYAAISAALIFSVIGHGFSPWINWRGGRGLAVAAGGALFLSLPILVLWCVFWLAGYLFRKDVHFGNISATFLTGAVALSSGHVLNKYTTPPAYDVIIAGIDIPGHIYFGITMTLMLTIILIKHYKPLLNWIEREKKKVGVNKNDEI